MSTRVALGLTVLLLALAMVQWRLRSQAEPPSAAPAAAPPTSVSLESEPAAGREPADEIEEPVLEIPEYEPPPITERPRTPIEFAAPELEIDIELPRLEGLADAEGS